MVFAGKAQTLYFIGEMLAKLKDLPGLDAVFYGNQVWEYIAAAFILAAAFTSFLLFRSVAISRLRLLVRQTETGFDDLLVDLFWRVTKLEYFLYSFFISSQILHFSKAAQKSLKVVFLAAVTFRVVVIAQQAAAFLIREFTIPEGKAEAVHLDTARNIGYLADLALGLGGLLFFLDNLGVNITSMLAGLGIGGVAVALAAQSILGDLFSAVAIYLDKPFEVGDFIVLDDYKGAVEHIGLKTTRVRSISGEVLVFANSQLTSSRIRNYQLLKERRVVLNFGLINQTPVEKVKTVPRLVKDIIANTEKVRLDRVHFSGLGESALQFEAVYFVLDPDYNLYMDLNQRILLSILESLDGAGVRLAYPTRTLYNEGPAAVAKA